jgi:hypothetical protein
MDKNISWTSSLGDAYVNQQQDVMDAVQALRQRAQQAGTLKSDSQEVVATQGNTIVIQPANPAVVYVPAYDPWTIYGGPLAMYPGWVPVPGIFYSGPGLYWGLGIGVGLYAGFGWGWHNWGADWRGHELMFNHARFVSRSNTFIDRRTVINRTPPAFNRGPAINRGPVVDREPFGGSRGFVGANGGFAGNHDAARGFAPFHGNAGTRSGAFSGFGHGGTTGAMSARGHASFGGGFRGGGGGHR